MAKSPKQNSNGTTKRNLRSKGPPIAFKSAPSQNMSKQSSHNNIRTKRSPSSTKNHSHHEINSKSIESSGAISNSAIKSELKNGTKSSSDAINSVYNESNNSIMRKNNSIDKKSPPKKKKIIKTSSCKVTKNAETTMAKGDNATNKITSTNGHVSSPRGRGHRVASLNAMFKVHLMYESQRKRGSDEESDYQVASSTSSSPSRKPKSKPTVTPNKAALQQNSKATSAKDSSGKKSKKSTHVKKETSKKKEKIKKTVKKVETKKKATKESEKDSSKGKELVLVDPKSKQIKVARKRKLANEDVEIIDTRLCKRMASLNASAILAASYLPEKIVKRSRSIESSRSIGSTVEMIQETKISSSISRVQVPSSTTIHSVHETNHVVVESAKTIETVKEVRRMSGKIRDRLVAIEMMERENDASKEPLDTVSNNRSKSRITSAKQTNQTSVRRSTKTNRRTDHHLNHQHPVLNGPEATGVRTTEYQVTKVQMSTNKGTHMKREKLAHQIETILEKDAVVREYQFQSKATSQSYRIQMESSSYNQPVTNVLNSSTVHALPCLPIHTPSVSDLHLNSGPSVIQSAPILTTNQGLNHAACFTHPNQPVLQIACNSPYRALQPASISQLPVLNIGPQYPSHYASAFSVPHYSNPAASINYSTETYGFYPPGSIIQPIHDPYIRAYPLHKPIPFHASPMVHTRTDQTYPDYGASMSSMSTQTSTGSLHQQSQTPSNHQQQQPQLQPQHTTLLTPTLQSTLITSNNITRPTPTTTIQIEPLRPHFENTNSFILHQPISDLSYTFRPHEIISREEPVILPLDVPRSTSISSINMNHNMNNQSVPSNTNNESTSEATVINSNCERPPSVTFLGTSSGSSSRGSISRLFSGITNNTGLGRGMSPIPGPSPVAVATPVSVDSTGTHQRSPLTVITEVFPVKRNNIEPKKSGTETHVSITPLMCEPTSSRSSRDISTSNCSATPIGSQRNDRAPSALNHNHHHNPNSSSSNSSLNRVNNDKHASSSSTSSTSKTISTTSNGCQPSRPSNSSAICAVIPQRAPRKEAFLPPNPNISKKTTNQVKLKRPPTVPVCNINSQKKATSVACIPVNVAPPMKKKSPNLSKTRIEIVQADSRVSPNSDPSMSKKSGKKRLSHGWSWEGKPSKELVYVKAEDPPQLRDCYPAICHIQGDIIRVRDCVLLRSGPRKTDLHFVAKIGALWEAPDTGEMMMSLLWYYRPEHTEPGRKPHQMPDEIFASKHRDVNSVACIDDKCYVLTFNEYCRYRRELKMKAEGQKTSLIDTIVPLDKETYFRKKRLPSGQVCPDRVFCCRKVYDFRLKRTLKNPI